MNQKASNKYLFDQIVECKDCKLSIKINNFMRCRKFTTYGVLISKDYREMLKSYNFMYCVNARLPTYCGSTGYFYESRDNDAESYQ